MGLETTQKDFFQVDFSFEILPQNLWLFEGLIKANPQGDKAQKASWYRRDGENRRFHYAQSRGNLWGIITEKPKLGMFKSPDKSITPEWNPDEIYNNIVVSNFNAVYFCHPAQELFMYFLILDLRSFDFDFWMGFSDTREIKRFKSTFLKLRRKYRNGLSGIMRSFRINRRKLAQNHPNSKGLLSDNEKLLLSFEAWRKVLLNANIKPPHLITDVKIQKEKGKSFLIVSVDMGKKSCIQETAKSIKSVFWQIAKTNRRDWEGFFERDLPVKNFHLSNLLKPGYQFLIKGSTSAAVNSLEKIA
jgi:hypothetical protein